MKRLLLTAGAIAALAAGASTADAAIAKGNFAGLVGAKANGDAFGFRVDDKGRVYSVRFTGVTLTCTDEDKFDSGLIRTSKNERYKVDSEGRWGLTYDNKAAGWGFVVAAKFKSGGSSAKGTLRIKANFDELNEPDPDGTRKCDSGLLKWSAKRQ